MSRQNFPWKWLNYFVNTSWTRSWKVYINVKTISVKIEAEKSPFEFKIIEIFRENDRSDKMFRENGRIISWTLSWKVSIARCRAKVWKSLLWHILKRFGVLVFSISKFMFSLRSRDEFSVKMEAEKASFECKMVEIFRENDRGRSPSSTNDKTIWRKIKGEQKFDVHKIVLFSIFWNLLKIWQKLGV